MNKTLFRTLCIIGLIILSYFSWKGQKKQTQQQFEKVKRQNQKALDKTSLPKAPKVETAQKILMAQCIGRGNNSAVSNPVGDLNVRAVNTIAQNIHFRRNGETYRLRKFIEDGKEGSYEKLVFYKEDPDGFARIVAIPKEDEVNPTDETLKKYLRGGKIIYEEGDYQAQTNKGEILFTLQQGKLTKTLGLSVCP